MEQNQENIIQVPQANTDRQVESVNSQNDIENQVKGDGIAKRK